MTDLDFDAALQEGAVRTGSHFAQRASADADAARALAGAVLRQLPLGAAEGEDDAAWAALGLADQAEESIDLPGSEFDVPAISAAELLEADDAYADAWVPTAPQAVVAPKNRGWMLGVAATFLLGVGAFAAFFAISDDDDGARFLAPTSTASAASVAAPASVAATSAAPATAQAPATGAAAPDSGAPTSVGSAPDAPTSDAPASASPAPKTTRSAKRTTRRSPAKARPTAEDKPPVAAAPATTAPKRPARKATAEVDDLLGGLGGGGKPAKRSAPRPSMAAVVDPSLPEKLTKTQILKVVRSNASKVSSCKRAGASGTVKVAMTIGRTGRVTSAMPQGAFAGTPAGVCVAAKVRTFRFPQFSGDPMRINMPFRL